MVSDDHYRLLFLTAVRMFCTPCREGHVYYCVEDSEPSEGVGSQAQLWRGALGGAGEQETTEGSVRHVPPSRDDCHGSFYDGLRRSEWL